MKNRECNMIYVAITVYAVVVSEVAAERSSVGCWGDALCTTPAGAEGTLSCRTGQRAKGGGGVIVILTGQGPPAWTLAGRTR